VPHYDLFMPATTVLVVDNPALAFVIQGVRGAGTLVVDVLASSEVSVSLTIEERSHLGAVMRDLAELGEVSVD